MIRIVSLVLLIAGLVLIACGVNASESMGSELSRFFTGSPTDRALWFLIGGIIAAILGSSGLIREFRHN